MRGQHQLNTSKLSVTPKNLSGSWGGGGVLYNELAAWPIGAAATDPVSYAEKSMMSSSSISLVAKASLLFAHRSRRENKSLQHFQRPLVVTCRIFPKCLADRLPVWRVDFNWDESFDLSQIESILRNFQRPLVVTCGIPLQTEFPIFWQFLGILEKFPIMQITLANWIPGFLRILRNS